MFGRKRSQAPSPDLKQFGDLRSADFDRHPVWIACHSADADEPWFAETDEETFRPWTGPLPVSASEGMLLVRAAFHYADGTRCSGFVTPAFDPNDLGQVQPHVFAGNDCFGFWGGMFGIPQERRGRFYAALGRSPEVIFPIRFTPDGLFVADRSGGVIEGFYRLGTDGLIIER